MSAGRAESMKLKKVLEKQGYLVERTGSGHWKVTHPERDGVVVFAFSPKHTGQHRTLKRLRETFGFEMSAKA